MTGDAIDVSTVNFHQMVGGIAGRQAITRIRTESRVDYVNYLAWEVAGALSTLSALAEELGETLDRTPPEFDDTVDLVAPSVEKTLQKWTRPDSDYDSMLTLDLIAHAELVLRRGRSLEDGYCQDVERLVGTRLRDANAADAALEAFVLSAGPERDVDLIHLFHRCTQRQRLLIPPTAPEGRPPGSVSPFLDSYYLEPVRSILARIP